RKILDAGVPSEDIDVLIPRKTLAELTKLTSSFEGEIGLGADENHIYFEVGPRLLISRTLTGQFPNYEMVMPKTNDKTAEFNSVPPPTTATTTATSSCPCASDFVRRYKPASVSSSVC